MKRKDFVDIATKDRVLDAFGGWHENLSGITTHTLKRWLRKAKRTQRRVRGCKETAAHEQWAYDLARDIIRVLEKKP